MALGMKKVPKMSTFQKIQLKALFGMVYLKALLEGQKFQPGQLHIGQDHTAAKSQTSELLQLTR